MGWANAFWQIMQMLVVFFGVTHGINGVRMVIEDYIGSTMVLRPFLRGVIFICLAVLTDCRRVRAYWLS